MVTRITSRISVLRRTALFGLTIAAALALPTTQAQIVLGSEDEPELWDDGAVRYTIPESTPHDYLDINRSWFGADASETWLTLQLRVLSTKTLEASSSTWWVGCAMMADLWIQDNPTGEIIEWKFDLNQHPFSTGFENSFTNSTRVGKPGAGSDSAPVDPRLIPATFAFQVGEPGYYMWTVGRNAVVQYGTEVANLRGYCREYLNIAGVPGPRNDNYADSKSVYSVESSRQTAGPDGNTDDLESLSANISPIQNAESPEEPEAASGFSTGLVALAVAATAGVCLRRAGRQ